MTRAGTRRALITGASRGIGAAVARRRRSDGVAVLGVHRRTEPPEALADAWVQADLGAPEEIANVTARAIEFCGGADGGLHEVVLAAGIAIRSAFADASVDGIDPLRAQLEVDLVSPLLLIRGLLRAGVLAGDASIVMIGSNLARRGLAGKVAYSAAKAGLEGAARGLAAELGPMGIRVNAVAPGLVRTDMTAGLGDAGFAGYAESVPLRRVGTPEDIAGVVAFLCSAEATYVTGQVLDVDGGWSVSTLN